MAYTSTFSGPEVDDRLTSVKPIFTGALGGLFFAAASGALADDATDETTETAAIQAALDAAGVYVSPPTEAYTKDTAVHNLGQGTVVLHAGGRHSINDTLSIPPGVTLDLNGSTIIQTATDKDAISLSYADMSGGGYGHFASEVKNGIVIGPGRDTSTARGVFCEVLNYARISNLTIYGFKFGMTLHECQYNTFDTMRIRGCEVGLYMTARPDDTTLVSIDNSFINFNIGRCGYGAWLQCAGHNLFDRACFSRNDIVDIQIGSQLVGYISGYEVTAGGSGYAASSTVPVTVSGDGTMAQAYAITNASGEVTSVVGVDGGDGYTTATVTIGGSGSGATATATISDDTGLGDWDGAPVEVRGHNIFYGLKIEHNTDDIPASGYSIIVNDSVCRRNVFEHPSMQRQTSGDGPTHYMRLLRNSGSGTVVSHPQDTTSAGFSTVENPAVSGDFSIIRTTKKIAVEWGMYQGGDDVLSTAVGSDGLVDFTGNVAHRAFDESGYTMAPGFVAKNSWTGTAAMRAMLLTDSESRFEMDTKGEMTWGNGSGAGDTTLERVAAGVLGVSGLAITTTAPSSASDTGTAGQVAVDADYIYICTAADTWKRVAVATW